MNTLLRATHFIYYEEMRIRNTTDFNDLRTTLNQNMQICFKLNVPPGQDSSQATTVALTTSDPTASSRSTTTESSAPSTSSKFRAEVIGGVAAGSVVLIALVAFFLVLRRKQALKRHHHVESVISPYTELNPTSEKRPKSKSSLGQPTSPGPRPTSSSTEQQPQATPPNCEPSHNSHADLAQRTNPGEAETTRRRSHHAPRIVVHEDSGWRPAYLPSPVQEESPSDTTEVVEMPPQYDAAV
ncbi:hypothetical protein Moror_1568 [Moniliophthora roreri MCA 2997]|uniref:Mid2 domain-containing protein n=2 Tax=Moniliophthora roreri TaxID=221103 RepID=V2XIK9_MONRO|nr:hypothetical protein Moror_1568 [Moniliophthora roreri MCA 2997]